MAAMWQSGSNFGKTQIFILLLLLFWRYEVLGASIGASADEAFGVGEDAAERRGVAAGEGRAGFAFHSCEDSGGCHILTFVVAGRNGEALVDACQTGLHRKTLLCALVDGLPAVVPFLFRAVLGIAQPCSDAGR